MVDLRGAQWLALLPHSKKVCIARGARGVVSPVGAWVLSGCFGFFPQSQKHAWGIGGVGNLNCP